MLRNKQIVVLTTEEGSAYSLKILKKVWEQRLKEVAPHYRVKTVKILKFREV